MSFKNILLSGLGITTISGGSLVAAYGATRETIFTQLKEQVMTSENLSDWKILKKSVQDTLNNKNSELGDLKERIEKEKEEESELKKWCNEQYKVSYSNIFKSKSEQEDNLKNLTKELCVLHIEKRLEAEKKIDRKELLNENLEKIRNKKEEEFKDEDLKKVKNLLSGNAEQDKAGDELLKFCQKIYKKPFQNENTEEWLLTLEYCLKNN